MALDDWPVYMSACIELAEGNHKTAIPEAYLIVWDEGSTSGVISTPFSIVFDMSKTANDATTDSQRVSFAICKPETTGPISI